MIEEVFFAKGRNDRLMGYPVLSSLRLLQKREELAGKGCMTSSFATGGPLIEEEMQTFNNQHSSR